MAGFGLFPGALPGWMVFRFRRRNGSALASLAVALLAAVLSCSALLASGCNGITQSSAAPGTYVLQITGTGTGSNVIQYANLTLTITN